MVPSPYLFLELALLVFVAGFGWEQWRLRDLRSRWFLVTAFSLAGFWFAIDQIAVHLGLWSFPPTKESSFRLVSLPVEEYVMFCLHTVVCLIFLNHYSESN